MKTSNFKNLEEGTFSVIRNKCNNYTFAWNDGSSKPFVNVSFEDVLVLSKHFNSINYACSNFSVGDNK